MCISRWNALMAALLFMAGMAVPAFNILVDPYGVFGIAWARDSYAMNERYLKVDHVLKHPNQYDSFMLGSSVMGVFDPAFANRLSAERRFYNLSFMAGTPAEAWMALKTLKRHGVHVKDVIMGLDVFSFREMESSDRPDRRMHPAASGNPRWVWLGGYLFAPSFLDGMSRLSQNFGSEHIRYDIAGGGRYLLVEQDAARGKDPERYVQERLRIPAGQTSRIQWVEARFKEFEGLVAWLNEEGVQARFFIHPVNGKVQSFYAQASMEEFRARIRQIAGNIPDFTLDPAAGEDRHYYDFKHYTPALAERVMRVVMDQSRAGFSGGEVPMDRSNTTAFHSNPVRLLTSN